MTEPSEASPHSESVTCQECGLEISGTSPLRRHSSRLHPEKSHHLKGPQFEPCFHVIPSTSSCRACLRLFRSSFQLRSLCSQRVALKGSRQTRQTVCSLATSSHRAIGQDHSQKPRGSKAKESCNTKQRGPASTTNLATRLETS